MWRNLYLYRRTNCCHTFFMQRLQFYGHRGAIATIPSSGAVCTFTIGPTLKPFSWLDLMLYHNTIGPAGIIPLFGAICSFIAIGPTAVVPFSVAIVPLFYRLAKLYQIFIWRNFPSSFGGSCRLSQAFMRVTVLVQDLAIFFPAAIALARRSAHATRHLPHCCTFLRWSSHRLQLAVY